MAAVLRSLPAAATLLVCHLLTAEAIWAEDQLVGPDRADPAVHHSPPSNTVWEELVVEKGIYDSPYRVSLFTAPHGEDAERLWSQTASIGYYGLATAAFLALLPEEVTSWRKSSDSLAKKWFDNVTSAPVWDNDDLWLNYIGHPYFGGVFYITARKSGYRQWDSFIYSFMMSTFYWEYGIEAFAEIPSLQDLVVTPLLGWVYGEWAFTTEREIWLNGGTVRGSECLGSVVLFLLDPIDSIGRNLNTLLGTDIIKAGTGYVSYQEGRRSGYGNDRQVIFTVNYTVGLDDSPAQPGISGTRRPGYGNGLPPTGDPVHLGVVGLSLGRGYARRDKDSGFADEYYHQIALGLYLSPRFSMRLFYDYAEPQHRQSQRDIAFERYGVDFQYYFHASERVRPYITSGLGDSLWKEESKNKQFEVNGGLGFHIKLNDNWALQVDAINFYAPETYHSDLQFGGSVVYRFGKGET